MRSVAVAALAAMPFFIGAPAQAQDACPNRGQLDTQYCDANNDLVADTPPTVTVIELPPV